MKRKRDNPSPSDAPHPAVVPASVQAVNRERCDRWHGPDDDWTLGDWSNAFMGEAGELANIVKKLRRHDSGASITYNTPEVAELRARFAEEVADVRLYLDLLCWKAGVSDAELDVALVAKFNAVSFAQGWDDLLVTPEDRPPLDDREAAFMADEDAVAAVKSGVRQAHAGNVRPLEGLCLRTTLIAAGWFPTAKGELIRVADIERLYIETFNAAIYIAGWEAIGITPDWPIVDRWTVRAVLRDPEHPGDVRLTPWVTDRSEAETAFIEIAIEIGWPE